jgi:hypothetical protein
VERAETIKMLISTTTEIRSWIEQQARTEDRTLSSVVNRALRTQMRGQRSTANAAARKQREQAVVR